MAEPTAGNPPYDTALLVLLEERRLDLALELLPRWEALEGLGRAVWVACGHDLTPAGREAFEEEATLPVVWVLPDGLAERVDDLPSSEDVAASPLVEAAYLHKMAELREAVRQAALASGATWHLWLDADVLPPPYAVPYLRQTLTETSGPHRPQAVTAAIVERRGGELQASYWGAADEPSRTRVALRDGLVLPCGYAGMGCVLMHREALARTGWEHYGRYRYERRRQLEQSWRALQAAGALPGPMGEDVYWFRRAELAHAAPLYVDGRVVCRHYNDDGSYWVAEPDADGYLVPRRVVPVQALTVLAGGAAGGAR